MEITSKTLTGILAGIFVILFVVTTALTFALYSVEQSAFDAQLYNKALEEENIYQRLPDLIAQTLHVAVQNPDASISLALLRNFSEDEWRMYMIELLPPKELEILAEDTITQLIAYINGENDAVVLSLVSLKAHLSSPQGINAIYGILKAQPDCTAEQLTAMALGQQDMLLCNPPDTFLFFDLRPIIEAEIKAAVALVPQQATLIPANSSQPQEFQDLQNLRLVMRLSPLLPMLCLLMITILAVRSLSGWLNWWGFPLLAAGFISMSLSTISRPLAAVTFQVFISPVLPETLSLGFVNIFKDLTASIVYNAVQPTAKVAGFMALTGLVMIAIPFVIRVLKKRSVETGQI
jgi:hypothetical protein